MTENNLFGYRIYLTKKAQKIIKNLSKSDRENILSKIKKLISSNHSLDIRKLKGYENFFRIRIGSYRVVYEPLHKKIVVEIIFVGHRKDIYNNLKKYF